MQSSVAVPLLVCAELQAVSVTPGNCLCHKTSCASQQAWSNQTQQILVPAWQQVAPVAAPATSLASDPVAGPQRLGDWGWVLLLCHTSGAVISQGLGVLLRMTCSINLPFLFLRKMITQGTHYSSMIPQPLLTHQITLSAPQPISVGIAHVVWPQPAATKMNKLCQNRWVEYFWDRTFKDGIAVIAVLWAREKLAEVTSLLDTIPLRQSFGKICPFSSSFQCYFGSRLDGAIFAILTSFNSFFITLCLSWQNVVFTGFGRYKNVLR